MQFTKMGKTTGEDSVGQGVCWDFSLTTFCLTDRIYNQIYSLTFKREG